MVLDQIQRYRVHTIPPTHELNLSIICFIRWGPKNCQKYKMLLFYRFTGCMAKSCIIIFFTGRIIFLPDAWFLTYHEI